MLYVYIAYGYAENIIEQISIEVYKNLSMLSDLFIMLSVLTLTVLLIFIYNDLISIVFKNEAVSPIIRLIIAISLGLIGLKYILENFIKYALIYSIILWLMHVIVQAKKTSKSKSLSHSFHRIFIYCFALASSFRSIVYYILFNSINYMDYMAMFIGVSRAITDISGYYAENAMSINIIVNRYMKIYLLFLYFGLLASFQFQPLLYNVFNGVIVYSIKLYYSVKISRD